MPENNEGKQTTTLFYAINSDSSLAKAIAVVFDKAARHQHPYAKFELSNFVAEMLTRGLKDFSDYLDRDKERRDKEEYFRREKLIALPDPSKPEELSRYANEIISLRQRYGIGASKKAL